MSIKTYIKRGIHYICHGQPVNKVYPQIVTLAPSELLKGRTALITGGTSGIGYEIAKAYINAGATCVITGRNEDKVRNACDRIDSDVVNKNKIYGIVLNNTEVSSMKSKLDKILEMVPMHQVDILVNNAGVVGGEIKDCTEEKYNLIVDTNLKGVFFLSQIMGRYMCNNHIEGNIINIGSSSCLRPATSAYSITKNAILGLTKGLAKILAPHGIIVNGIAPGPTATPMLMPNGIRDNISFPNQLGRYELPEEIANMAVFLVSNMGKSIIGDMVFMTGGSGVVTYDDVHYSF